MYSILIGRTNAQNNNATVLRWWIVSDVCEVKIIRNDDALLGCRKLQQCGVRLTLKPRIMHRFGVVTKLLQQASGRKIYALVKKEPHSSNLGHNEHKLIIVDNVFGIFDTGMYIFRLEARIIVTKDLLVGQSICKQFQHGSDRYTRSLDTWFAAQYLRI